MKLLNKRLVSFLLAAVMLLGMMPSVTINVFAAQQTTTNEFEGKTISILGASMSTYTGISNNPDYNSTIGNNAVYYTEGRYGVYANDTWWMQTANDLGLRLLVNNSWSGSSLLHERNGTVGAYVDRCVQLHNNDGEEPDIIGIQMGTNDFQYYKDTLGTADIDYAALITENEDGSYTYAVPVTSLEAAAIVLHKISIRYPDAEVYYLNISQRIDGTDELIRSFNAELKQVVEHFGAQIVDIYGSAITMADFDTYIGDGRVHPNCLGMDAYTEAFKRALLANAACEVDTHTVSLDLNGVTADYGDDKIVVSGDAFSCKLTAEDSKELSVSVTMGGEDITDITYENGTISIESVTDDVVITAEATVHEPQNYRWEFDGTDLACVSGGNALTKDSGTTTDGVFSKTSYTLENEVVLMHDLPWVVDWKCEGTFQNSGSSSGARIFTSDNVNANYNARFIFKSNTNGIVAMGEKTSSGSHNYGIALGDYGIDWTALHTYRLENRIAEDGSNMIYLLVDGKEIGPMNHYYIGTKDQATTSDWLSGKDFVFPYMGTDTHGFTNASIDYIQVWEIAHTHSYETSVTAPTCTEQGYTTYTCDCGDSYVDDYVDAKGEHDFTEWSTIKEAAYNADGEESRKCSKCSHVEFRSVSVSVVTSGNLGKGTTPTDKVIYTLYSDGTMVLEGTGALFGIDWRGDNQPFIDYRKQVKHLVIGEGITSTTSGSLVKLSNLETIQFPSTLTHLPQNALMSCFRPDITKLTIPATVVHLGAYSIGHYTGDNSAYFTDVIIENPNIQITDHNAVFNGGAKLDQLTLYSYGVNNNVSSYAEKYGCKYVDLETYKTGEYSGVTYLYYSGVLTFSTTQNNATITGEDAPWNTVKDSVKKVVIGSGITGIAANAFKDYCSLESVELNNEIRTVGDGAFSTTETCNVTLTLTLPRTVKSVGAGIFAGRQDVNLTAYLGSAAAEIKNQGVKLTLKKQFQLLLIGNSYSEDASSCGQGMTESQLLNILQAMLGKDAEVTVALLSSGGKGMHWHATQAEQGNRAYSFKVISTTNPTWKSMGSYTSADALAWTDWDAVSLQPYNINVSTGQESVPYPDSTDPKFYHIEASSAYMLDHVAHYAPDADIYFYMHWAQTSSTVLNAALSTYNKHASFMPKILDYAGTESGAQFKTIIPVGLSIQNARTTYLALLRYNTTAYADGNLNLTTDAQIGLQRDGGHVSFNIGRYIAGLTFAETIVPQQWRVDNYVLPEIRVTESVGKLPKEYSEIAQKAVHAAVETWRNGSLAVTNIDGYTEDPTVAARKTLESLELNLNCGDATSIDQQICTSILSTLPADFAVETVILDADRGIATVTIRFGYTSVTVDLVYSTNHTYSNGICTGCGEAQPGPVITQQPTNGEAKLGEHYMVEVKAEGEGLKYQWYFRNAGSSKWNKSSVKDNTYDDVMTTARAGREVYCVITDANGNSVKTDTVKLVLLPSEELEITQQPTDDQVYFGEHFCATVEAKGEKLKYQWYFRNAGSDKWYKSSVKDNTYDDVMTKARAGREIYCVITDAYGNSVTTETVKLICIPTELEIISQPTSAEVSFGEMFCATVETKGDGLKYQWYFRNSGTDKWYKSGVRDNTYDDVMTNARNHREIYCVITDMWGNSVTTDTVKLTAVPSVELKVLSQSYESAVMGERYCVTVEAQGDGLNYQWYFRNAGASRWSKSGVRDNTYDDVMNKTRANREVYCVISDACGNQITTEVITLTVEQ